MNQMERVLTKAIQRLNRALVAVGRWQLSRRAKR